MIIRDFLLFEHHHSQLLLEAKMGAGASKQAARKLPKTVPSQVSVPANAPRILDKRPPSQSKVPEGKDGTSHAENDMNMSEKLHKLGVVQFHEIKLKYNKNNEFLNAIQQRAQLDRTIPDELNDKSVPKRYLHPETIRGVIESRDSGEADQEVKAIYHIDQSVLDKLRKFSVAPIVRKPAVIEEATARQQHQQTVKEPTFERDQQEEQEVRQRIQELEARSKAVRLERENLEKMQQDPDFRHGPIR
jgi:hypothetical protein